jgi:hypothetical protein
MLISNREDIKLRLTYGFHNNNRFSRRVFHYDFAFPAASQSLQIKIRQRHLNVDVLPVWGRRIFMVYLRHVHNGFAHHRCQLVGFCSGNHNFGFQNKI